MGKHSLRFFVGADGDMSVEDPSPLEASVLRSLGIVLPENGLASCYGAASAHSRMSLDEFRDKREKLTELLRDCNLCGHRCGGARARAGSCPAGSPARYHQCFVHVGEEPEIGRTLAVELAGCNMRCKFCQKGELIEPVGGMFAPFTPAAWDDMRREYETAGFDNISFLGGNPDQSAAGALDFLEHAPDWAKRLPVVWHTNGYSDVRLLSLLAGFVDLWVFDFKYFSDGCAATLSGAEGYVEMAKHGLDYLCAASGAPVIVRHLILPGHFECCQKPLLSWLENRKSNIILNPMDQYRPLWRIRDEDGAMSGTVGRHEFERVVEMSRRKGITLTSGLSGGA